MNSKIVVIPAKAGIQELLSSWNDGFPLSWEWHTWRWFWLIASSSIKKHI